ncbi:MAG: hypothetical protein V4678_02075 [Patescibacteria group bacterium]
MKLFKHKNHERLSLGQNEPPATLLELEVKLATVLEAYELTSLVLTDTVCEYRSGNLTGSEYAIRSDILSMKLQLLAKQKEALLMRIDQTTRLLGHAALQGDQPRAK